MMKPTQEPAILTVAAIRKSKRSRPAEYLFNEREQIFRLAAKDGDSVETRAAGTISADTAKVLQEALRRNIPVEAVLEAHRGAIRKAELLPQARAKAFHERRKLLARPGKALPVEVSRMKPELLNSARKLKARAFADCTRVVPNRDRAVEIFDYCARQSCAVPPPYNISPCIPFQYVIDGCYARAHKIRWIITTKYRYCCEKVFSFANANYDALSVKADKWGGCCVGWWYHVAPLIRVKLKGGKVPDEEAMVIDPGMFNAPVLLSEWLAAQENTGCNPDAHVSMYSIQPGSAYGPADYSGTSYLTDDSYTATDATLIAYHSLTTCPP